MPRAIHAARLLREKATFNTNLRPHTIPSLSMVNRTHALALLSVAICAAITLTALHGSRDEKSNVTEQAALQTSLFMLPEFERPPHHYTGKWCSSSLTISPAQYRTKYTFVFAAIQIIRFVHTTCCPVPMLIFVSNSFLLCSGRVTRVPLGTSPTLTSLGTSTCCPRLTD